MKYLSDYTEKATTEALNKAGGFFAFSQKQFDEAKKEGVKYISLGAGLLCEKGKENQLIKELEQVTENGMKQDLKENGKEGVILRELNNHEAYYTGELQETIDALKGYDVTRKEVAEVYNANRAKEMESYC